MVSEIMSLCVSSFLSLDSDNTDNGLQGPITEEILFRSCILGTAAMYGRSRRYLIFVTPLYFGIGIATNDLLYFLLLSDTFECSTCTSCIRNIRPGR